MKHALDLWSWEGRVTRAQYVAAGAALFAVKLAADTAVSSSFGEPWSPLMYVSPRVSPLFHPGAHPAWWFALLAVALPFIAAGVSLSARRLRDMGVHPFWSGLFFLPFVHFAFFFALAISPPRGEGARVALDVETSPLLARVLPNGEGARFAVALAASVAFGIAGMLASGLYYEEVLPVIGGNKEIFGVGAFVGVPFGMGFIAAFVTGFARPPGWVGPVACAAASVVVGMVVLLGLAFEGVACIVMAAPLVLPLAIGGGVVGYLCTRRAFARGAIAGILIGPLLIARDRLDPPRAEPFACVSTIRIDAPPDVVFRNVVSFPPIDQEPSAIFAILAAPLEARIDGRGRGALRRCIFTIGEFEEPILVWDEGRELTFGVRGQPASVARYVDVTQGQFLIIANADGSTTIRGTTWYRLGVFPTAYWSRWTQSFLHAIHERVLEHVKRVSEHPDEARARAAPMPMWMAAANATCGCTRHTGQ